MTSVLFTTEDTEEKQRGNFLYLYFEKEFSVSSLFLRSLPLCPLW